MNMNWVISLGEKDRMKTAQQAVVDYLHTEYPDTALGNAFPDDIYIVWFSKTLQNWKVLLSTDLVDSGIYFELTYNGDRDELYLDHYTKYQNVAISMNPTSGAPNVA